MCTASPKIYTLSYTTLFRSKGKRGEGLSFEGRNEGMAAHAVALLIRDGGTPQPSHGVGRHPDRKSTRLNSSHRTISYAVFCLKKKKKLPNIHHTTCAPFEHT